MWNSRGGSGVTLVKIRTFKLDPCFEKRFKQRSKTVRLFDRCQMCSIQQFVLCTLNRFRDGFRCNRWRACVVAARDRECRQTNATQAFMHVEVAQGLAGEGVALGRRVLQHLADLFNRFWMPRLEIRRQPAAHGRGHERGHAVTACSFRALVPDGAIPGSGARARVGQGERIDA